MLDVDGRDIASRPPAQPLLGKGELVRPLEDDDVDVLVAQPVMGHLVRVVRPGEGLRAALAVRTGLFRLRLEILPVSDVERVIPRQKRVLLRSAAG